jgi:S-DNA-T family DNA segregation ATPase FtsK/SpoIIIE
MTVGLNLQLQRLNTVLNKQASSKQLLKGSPTLSVRDTLVPRLREGALIGFVASFLYFLVSLDSYDLSDPGWSRTGTGEEIVNSGGPTGAWLADVCFSLFGYMAYLFPMMIGYRAWILFRERYDPAFCHAG